MKQVKRNRANSEFLIWSYLQMYLKKVSIELVYICQNDEYFLDFLFLFFLDLMTSTFTSGKFLTKAKAIQS